jgi:hypothetical protein
MLKRAGINGQQVNGAIGRVAVFQRENLLKEPLTTRLAARHNRTTARAHIVRLGTLAQAIHIHLC